MSYKFELPWPPTANHFHQPITFRKNGKVLARNITSKEVDKYQAEVKRVMDELMLSGEMIERPVLIHLKLHPKTNHKYDCSNFLKAYEDAGGSWPGFIILIWTLLLVLQFLIRALEDAGGS